MGIFNTLFGKYKERNVKGDTVSPNEPLGSLGNQKSLHSIPTNNAADDVDFSRLSNRNTHVEEDIYGFSDCGMDPKFIELYKVVNEFYYRLTGKTKDKNPSELLLNLLVESKKVHKSQFVNTEKEVPTFSDIAIAACSLVSCNGQLITEQIEAVHRIISEGISKVMNGEVIIKYDLDNILIAASALKGIKE